MNLLLLDRVLRHSMDGESLFPRISECKRFHLFILFIDTKTFHLFSIVLKSFFALEAYGIGKCICMVIKIFCCKLYCSLDIIRYILLVCILS